MKNNIIGIIVFAILIVSGLAFAHTMGMGGGCCGGAHHTCSLHHAQ